MSVFCFGSLSNAQQSKVLLDNEWVKVSHVLDRPGDKRGKHSHKDTVVVALSDHKRRVVGEREQEFDIKAAILSLSLCGLIWTWIYHPTLGFLNQFLGWVGLESLQHAWLSEPSIALFAGGVGALIAPGWESALFARGAEAVFRNSLFRSSYEVFYTPIPSAEKRAAKSIIDVGFDRMGDAFGGAASYLFVTEDAEAEGVDERVSFVGLVEINFAAKRRNPETIPVMRDARNHA